MYKCIDSPLTFLLTFKLSKFHFVHIYINKQMQVLISILDIIYLLFLSQAGNKNMCNDLLFLLSNSFFSIQQHNRSLSNV